MGLLQHKKSKVQTELPPNLPEFVPPEPVGEGRAACTNRLEAILGTPSSKGAMLKLYLKNFKSLNKAFGYECCEELLSRITRYLAKLAEGNVYRYTGVKFIVALEQFSEGQISDLADEILERFGNAQKTRDVDCLCSARIGLCSYPDHAMAVDELIRRLDLTVASAAEYGPSQMSVCGSNTHTQFVRRQAIAMYLQTALEKHELEVRHHPTYNLKEGRFTEADSYMRIFIQGIEFVGIGEFLPTAEDSGQIHAIGYYASDHADQCITDLITLGKEFSPVCIPVSPILLVQKDFVDQVGLVVERYDIPGCELALEVGDSALSSVYLNVSIAIQELYGMGVELVMNNLGSGCAPVTSILGLLVHTVKLECMFVWQLETDPKSASIAGGLIQITKELGIHIIAEGMEIENQLNALNSYSYKYQQGFYYAPAVELDVLRRALGTTLEESWVTVGEKKMKMKR